MKTIVDILFGLGLVLALGGLGYQVARYILKLKTNFYAAFFIGCGLTILLLFSAGLLGIFSKVFFIIALIFLGLFIITGYRHLPGVSLEFTKIAIVPIALAILLFLIAGLAALSPPIKNDTLYYHLGLPRLWALSGGIPFYPTIAFSATALNCELLSTPVAAIVSPEAAQFFVFLIALIVCFYLAHELSRFTNAPAYYGLLFLAAIPLFVAGLSDSKNDYLASGFCLAGLFSYFDYLKNKHLNYLILSGIFIGLAAGTKTNTLIFAPAMITAVTIGRPRWKDFVYFILALAIFAIPWYLKAYIETGNPVYPFYNTVFRSIFWPGTFDSFNKVTMPASIDRGLLDFIISPFKLVYWPDLFRGRIGPLPLVFLPLLLVIKNHPRIIRPVLIVALIYYLIWYAVWANARYLMPIVLMLAFVSAYLAYRSAAKSIAVRLVIMVIVSLLILVNIAQLTRDDFTRIKVAFGIIDRDNFLREAVSLNPNNPGSGEQLVALPYYDIWQHANSALPKNATVGILCSNWNRADGFYLDRKFLYINPTEQKVIDFSLDSIRFENSIYKSQIDYFLIDKAVIEEFSPNSRFVSAPGFGLIADGVRRLDQYVKKNGRLEFQTDRYQLYCIK